MKKRESSSPKSSISLDVKKHSSIPEKANQFDMMPTLHNVSGSNRKITHYVIIVQITYYSNKIMTFHFDINNCKMSDQRKYIIVGIDLIFY